jgi:hypothetical protein
VTDLDAARHVLEPGLCGARPLDEGNGLGRQIVVEQRRVLLAKVGEAVEVEVRDRDPAVVGVADGERR